MDATTAGVLAEPGGSIGRSSSSIQLGSLRRGLARARSTANLGNMFASPPAPPLSGTLVPPGSTPAGTGSTLSNINVEVPATPPDLRGPPDTVKPPLQPPAPPSQPRGGSLVPAEEANPYRRRGQDSGDTPETAAARRARDMLMRDHRRQERRGEEVSSTSALS
ncbi:hypothetical protein P3342_000009 [Pyrenophora teres f. teres]|nr:hypothetical protein P3342_000009 [Pyrenophora teres f. teres]